MISLNSPFVLAVHDALRDPTGVGFSDGRPANAIERRPKLDAQSFESCVTSARRRTGNHVPLGSK